jgi:methyl halide transferase
MQFLPIELKMLVPRHVSGYGQRLFQNGQRQRARMDPRRFSKLVDAEDTIKESVQRARQVFQEDASSSVDPWERLWRDGLTPWDLGGPTPVLLSELRQRPRSWRTALIPGCGRGHDVVSLARFWDKQIDNTPYHRTVYGLDLSETSLHRAKEVLMESIQTNGPFRKTNIQLYQGDFFVGPLNWQLFHNERSSTDNHNLDSSSTTNISNNSTFDLIFDYTFFCAIPPKRRPEWGRQMSQILSKKEPCNGNQSGELLTLMFPYVAEPRSDSPGPPYLVSYQDYLDALTNQSTNGVEQSLRLTTSDPYPSADTVSSRVGQEMVGWWSFNA